MISEPANTVGNEAPATLQSHLLGLYVYENERMIAQRIKRSQTWVSERMNGKRKGVAKRHLKEVAAGLGITIDQLLKLCASDAESI